MDIREIQRLHAQFAPDTMVIDLPRQIAALPAPGDLSEEATTLGARARWSKAGPAARGTVLAVAAAAVLAMAGMGAASLYTAWRAGRHATPPSAAVETASAQRMSTTAAATQSGASFMDIDATPAHPVSTAPTLSAADFASGKALGLTADQFRDSLKAPTQQPPAARSTAASPALTTEAQLAAVSPIHRGGRSRETVAAAPQSAPATNSAPAAQAAAVKPAPSAPPAPAQVPATQAQAAAQNAPAPAPAVATQQAEVKKQPPHPAHRHASHPRAEQAADADPNAKPAAANRAGASEVQMF